MRTDPPINSNVTRGAYQYSYNCVLGDRSTHSSSRNTQNVPQEDDENTSRSSIFAKPFDQWTPQGGGAENDIYRRFKILASEEEDFLTHWARHRLSSGIFSRDDNGILVFRVKPAEIMDLSELSIARSDAKSESESQWTHVYDKEGVSWLTRSRYVEIGAVLPRIYDITRQTNKASENFV